MLVAFCCIVSGCGMLCYGTLWCLFSRMPWWPKMRHSPCALGEWSNASVGPWKSRSVTAWRCAWRCGGFHHRCSLILSLCLYTLFYSFQSLFACMTWHDVTRRSETESETGRLVLTLLYWFTLTKFEALNLHWSNWHKLALKILRRTGTACEVEKATLIDAQRKLKEFIKKTKATIHALESGSTNPRTLLRLLPLHATAWLPMACSNRDSAEQLLCVS